MHNVQGWPTCYMYILPGLRTYYVLPSDGATVSLGMVGKLQTSALIAYGADNGFVNLGMTGATATVIPFIQTKIDTGFVNLGMTGLLFDVIITRTIANNQNTANVNLNLTGTLLSVIPFTQTKIDSATCNLNMTGSLV